MLHEVVEAGYEITPEDIDADIIIINTCAFIESARKEAVDNILDVAWLKENRHLKGIIVTGCLAERYREEIFEEMPEVDALLVSAAFTVSWTLSVRSRRRSKRRRPRRNRWMPPASTVPLRIRIQWSWAATAC